MIKVNIVGDKVKYHAKPAELVAITEIINSRLESIFAECVLYNAFVKAIKTNSGNYKLEVVCDEYSTFAKMKDLLPEVIAGFE